MPAPRQALVIALGAVLIGTGPGSLAIRGFAQSVPLPPAQTAPVPDVRKPLVISCDEVISWSEGNVQVLWLRGQVQIEQGLWRARMEQAVAWITAPAETRKSPIIELYGEGHVQVNGQVPPPGMADQQALAITLTTENDVRIQEKQRRAVNAAEETWYRHALAERERLLRAQAPHKKDQTALAPIRQVVLHDVVPQGGPTPPAPAALGPTGIGLPRGDRPRRVQIAPRGAAPWQADIRQIGPNEYAWILLGGITLIVEDPEGPGLVDISADRAVLWTRNVNAEQFFSRLEAGQTTREDIEVYLEGHVQIRQRALRGAQTGSERLLRADRVYYHLSRNTALLEQGEVIAEQRGLAVPVYLRAREIRQVAQGRFEATDAEFFASRLPSDPGLKVTAELATLEEKREPRTGLFGRPVLDPRTGQPEQTTRLWGTGENLWLRVENVPILYLPYAQGDLRDPLGPLDRVRFRSDRVFGVGLLFDLDLYELLGAEAPPNSHWRLDADFLSKRGPALGSEFRTRGQDLLGLPGPYESTLRAWGIHDTGRDILGGNRTFEAPKDFRGRALVRHRQEIGDDWTFLGQISYLSDRNFLEQFFRREFEEEPNQETYAYLKWQRDHWAASLLVEPRIRSWVTETEWLPRGDLYLIGQPLWDQLTWFVHGSAGWAVFRPTSDIPRGFVETPILDEFARLRSLPPSSDFPYTGKVETGRLDLWQEWDWPLSLGPLRIVPYALFDVAYYTETLEKNDQLRLYGGGGARASLPLWRVYPEVTSDLFNLRGLAHKIVVELDYRLVRSNTDFRTLPELDRLDDDATDQARRDLRAFRIERLPFLTGDERRRADLLAHSPVFDPQLYAIRKLVTTAADTVDDVQVLRLGLDQRLQTKRGFPGREHILDWMTLDIGLSWFPDSARDNFGHSLALFEYDYTWHLGDRTSLLSSGWFDPFPDGARVFNIGLFLERPESLQYYLGFRTVDPVGSDVVLLSTTYRFSSKWAMTAATSYDFGENTSLGNSLVLTRIGSDLQLSIGINYEALRNNFGVTLEILPSVAPRTRGTALPFLTRR